MSAKTTRAPTAVPRIGGEAATDLSARPASARPRPRGRTPARRLARGACASIRGMSVRRCALAFAVLPLLSGCFKDDGAALTQTAGSLEPSSTTSPTTTTTSPDSTTTTTTGDSESATTTGEPVTTGTTAAPLCPGEMQCTPDEVMDTGALCDPCGRVRRTCQADCTWGPDECVDDPSSCAYWYLDDVQLGWERVALPQPPPRHAPAAPAIAAFDLQAHDAIVVLTATTYHVLKGDDQTWLSSGPLADVFPDLPFTPLQSYAVHNSDLDTYDVYAVGDPLAWIYTLALQPDGFTSQFALEGPCCNSFTPLVNPGTPGPCATSTSTSSPRSRTSAASSTPLASRSSSRSPATPPG
ncbi:hypothetical protein [Nannocystis pusilla]|uniref:hypothetical protein n=1 Tax=Nannocystis pusilla TaxID=889268 RepID=UPI003B781D24